MSRVFVSYFQGTYVDGRVLGLGFVMSVRIYLSWIKGFIKEYSLGESLRSKSPKAEGPIYFNTFTKAMWSL